MKLKTLLATVLLCLCATTMSAQAIVGNGNAANKIQNAQIDDQEYANIVSSLETSCAIVLKAPFLSLIEAKKAELNKEIEENYTSDPEYYDLYGLDALEQFIVDLEMQQGDVNLDGSFDIDDIQSLFDGFLGRPSGVVYDLNRADGFDIDDIQYAFNKFLGRI